MRTVPDSILPLTEHFESFQALAYNDGVEWADGYGHDGPEVKPGMIVTLEQAQVQLLNDMGSAASRVHARIGEDAVNALTEGQWGALLDFAYNTGGSAAEPIWAHVLSAPTSVPDDLAQRVTNRQGVALGGLILRRKWEAQFWNTVGVPVFVAPTIVDMIAARAQAVELNK